MSAGQENTVTDAQAQFEDWYVQNAFDYAANPIGSRDCGLMRRAWHAALAATGKQQVGEVHPDDAAVDAFADAMKAKMADARAKGRGGWEDPAQCSSEDLSRMLRDHVEKGDPRDVANFCMMLHQRREAIAARQPGAQVPFGWWLEDANGVGYFSRKMQPAALYAHRTTPGYSATPLHAAPPAQGIDLGQLSVQHVTALRDMREHMAAGTLSLNDWRGFGTAALDAVLALIDQRDAAPGVGNG